MALRLRRGTEAERIITPQQGELLYVTDTKKVYVGDGATPGGILVGPVDATLYDLVSDTTPQLGGNLDLNGNNIIGTGNINITGNITATGSINLGNGAEDNINVGGLINSSLTPAIDDSYSLGTSVKQWANVWATQVNIDTTLAVGSQIIKLSNGSVDSNLVLWDAETDTVFANTFEGNFVGSVFGDNSTTLVDGVNNTLSTGSLTLDGNNISSTTINFNYDESAVFNGKDIRVVDASANPNIGSAPGLIFQTSRGTSTSPLTIQLSDKVTSYTGAGWTGSSYSTLGGISIGASVGTTGTEALPGTITMFVLGDNGGFDTFAQLDGCGVFTSLALQSFGLTTTQKTTIINKFGGVGVGEDFVKGMIVYDTTLNKLTTFHPTQGWGDVQTSTAPHQLPVYANDAARSSAITSPSAGMVVFMTSGTTPTVSNKPVIYNGTAWEAF